MTVEAAAKEPAPIRALSIYFLAAPLFLVMDFSLSSPVRVLPIDDPLVKLLYYISLFLVGVFGLRRRFIASIGGLVDSALNAFLLVASVMMPLAASVESVMEGGQAHLPFTPLFFLNFFITAVVLVVAFNDSQRMIRP